MILPGRPLTALTTPLMADEAALTMPLKPLRTALAALEMALEMVEPMLWKMLDTVPKKPLMTEPAVLTAPPMVLTNPLNALDTTLTMVLITPAMNVLIAVNTLDTLA